MLLPQLSTNFDRIGRVYHSKFTGHRCWPQPWMCGFDNGCQCLLNPLQWRQTDPIFFGPLKWRCTDEQIMRQHHIPKHQNSGINKNVVHDNIRKVLKNTTISGNAISRILNKSFQLSEKKSDDGLSRVYVGIREKRLQIRDLIEDSILLKDLEMSPSVDGSPVAEMSVLCDLGVGPCLGAASVLQKDASVDDVAVQTEEISGQSIGIQVQSFCRIGSQFLKMSDKLLGTGSTAEVFFATLEGEEVAVKKFFRSSDFMYECGVHSLLLENCPFRAIAYCVEERAIVFPYYDGTKGWSTFEKPHKICYRKIFVRAALILLDLHDIGVVHNDLKVDNLMYNLQSGQIALIDFSHATHISDKEVPNYDFSKSQHLHPGLSHKDPSKRVTFSVQTDVFSFGVLIKDVAKATKNSVLYATAKGICKAAVENGSITMED
uniref:Protein kinase domain-containing protein n=1 Tax=Romanomermis culicivorax TaxID=13658 RepID=A0A915HNS3_ROMCU